MSLYQDWMNQVQGFQTEKEYSEFWKKYFDKEKSNYRKILSNYPNVYAGRVAELASEFGMTEREMLGFLDGINSSLADGPIELDELSGESLVELRVDLDKLYYNMLDAKADWLYTLPEWDAIKTPEEREEILRRFRASKVYVAEQTVGRNDPCPCGSGKKYKKCCGAANSK
ncbi:MAG: SEC-C metal-binding domain-containing protein [Clostridia bacterium]|nr:SEC-C metal-binding domain-containing protein [Clostridia bacterium]